MAKLPPPVCVTDEYLKAILQTQEEILGELKKGKPEVLPPGIVDLKEPSKHRKGKF